MRSSLVQRSQLEEREPDLRGGRRFGPDPSLRAGDLLRLLQQLQCSVEITTLLLHLTPDVEHAREQPQRALLPSDRRAARQPLGCLVELAAQMGNRAEA